MVVKRLMSALAEGRMMIGFVTFCWHLSAQPSTGYARCSHIKHSIPSLGTFEPPEVQFVGSELAIVLEHWSLRKLWGFCKRAWVSSKQCSHSSKTLYCLMWWDSQLHIVVTSRIRTWIIARLSRTVWWCPFNTLDSFISIFYKTLTCFIQSMMVMIYYFQ